MPIRASLVVMLLAALALAGCGRLGPLEPPPAKATAAAPAADDTTPPGTGVSPLDPGSGASTLTATTSAATPDEPPKKRFFLDFLL